MRKRLLRLCIWLIGCCGFPTWIVPFDIDACYEINFHVGFISLQPPSSSMRNLIFQPNNIQSSPEFIFLFTTNNVIYKWFISIAFWINVMKCPSPKVSPFRPISLKIVIFICSNWGRKGFVAVARHSAVCKHSQKCVQHGGWGAALDKRKNGGKYANAIHVTNVVWLTETKRQRLEVGWLGKYVCVTAAEPIETNVL